MPEKKNHFYNKEALQKVLDSDKFRLLVRILATTVGGYLVLSALAADQEQQPYTENYLTYVGASLLLLNLWLVQDEEEEEQGTSFFEEFTDAESLQADTEQTPDTIQ